MVHVFAKWHNPAYDNFLVGFFNGKGIPFNDKATLREMRARFPVGLDVELLPHERLFLDYLSRWDPHPETRPSHIEFLQNLFEDRRLTLPRLEELEASLPRGKGKILFSQDDVATDVFRFYRRMVINPLRRDIEKGSPWKLLDYFNADDNSSLPYSRGVGSRDFEKAVKAMADESLSWLDKVKTQTVLSDISLVFQQHKESGHRMQPTEATREDSRPVMRCEHNSKLVQLHCSRELEDSEDNLLLQPARGYGVVEDGWKDIIFPRFTVFEAPERAYSKNVAPKSPS